MPDSPNPPTPSPPRARHSQRRGPTRFEKEAAATGGKAAADHPGDPKVIGPWRIGRTIGKGASGRVKIAKHSKTGQYAAIKIVPKHALLMTSRMSMSEAGAKHDKAVLGIEREIVIMKLIDHPNVMSLYDVWETAKELYLVLEYVEGGELFDYLVSCGRLAPDEASRYFQQIIAGVDYCHRFNICHRDLKPENLLLDAEKNIKIADFGMAALEPSGRMLETSCGSPHYASPEIVAGMSYHGAASDIWSCGVILFALLTGRLPFDDENIRVLLQKVKNGRFAVPADLPADAKDLITRMLVVDPEKRITMAEIMRHPFFQRKQDTDSGRRINLVEPPRLEEIARPVRSEREVDRDILRNLRTLWNGASEREIVKSLLSEDKTWEKAFYFLLLQYRNKHLENFNPEPEQHRAIERRRKPDASSKQRHIRSSAQSGTSASAQSGQQRRIATARARAPPAPEVAAVSPRTATRPAPKSPATPIRGRPVIGPRAPSEQNTSRGSGTAGVREESSGSQRHASSEEAETGIPAQHTPRGVDPRLPKIILQRPTPQHDQPSAAAAATTGLGLSLTGHPHPSSTSSPSPSPSPNPTSPTLLTNSPPLGKVSVPTVQDAALQKFFHDIAEQLQLIGNNTAPSSPRSSIAMDSPALSQGGDDTAPGTPLPTPTGGGDVYRLPAVGGVVGGPRPKPVRAATEEVGRREIPRPVVIERRRSALGDASARENVVQQQRFSVQSDHKNKRTHVDSKRKSKPSPLDLSPMITQQDQLLSPTASPYMSSAPPSPLLVGAVHDIKQSWFSNLFSWKPAMFTLISADDCASSRTECVKLLESFGASVIVEDADGWGVLKCRVDEIRDVTGIIISKSVRFRIEFLPHSQWSASSHYSSSGSGSGGSPRIGAYQPRGGVLQSQQQQGGAVGAGVGAGQVTTSMTMVQEKGALSAFRAVYGRIRAEWRLDSLKSPAIPNGSRFTTSPLASPAISQDHAHGMWS